MRRLGKVFVEGLVSFLPFALTLYAVYFVFGSVYRILAVGRPLLPEALLRSPALAEAVTVALSLAVIVGVGALTQTVAGRAVVKQVSGWVEAIPLLKTVHSGVRQILEMLFRPSSLLEQRPVRVPFPHTEVMAFGLVTGELPESLRPEPGHRYLKVFVPTVPNPTSGYLVFYRDDDVAATDLSREHFLRIVLSGGVLDEEDGGAA